MEKGVWRSKGKIFESSVKSRRERLWVLRVVGGFGSCEVFFFFSLYGSFFLRFEGWGIG